MDARGIPPPCCGLRSPALPSLWSLQGTAQDGGGVPKETVPGQARHEPHLVRGRPEQGVGRRGRETAQHVAHRVGRHHRADAQPRRQQPCSVNSKSISMASTGLQAPCPQEALWI